MTTNPVSPVRLDCVTSNTTSWLEIVRAVASSRNSQDKLTELDSETIGNESPLECAFRVGATESVVLEACARFLEVPYFDKLSELQPASQFIAEIPISFARKHALIGVRTSDGHEYLVMGRVQSLSHRDNFRRLLQTPLTPAFAPAEAIIDMINASYSQRTGQAQTVVESIGEGDVSSQLQALELREDLLDGSSRSPVIQLVNALLFEAVQNGASDVHIQPTDDQVVVRMRIDGILFDAYSLPKSIQEEIISRIKVQGKMNIAEKRLPQDGRATVQVGDKKIDLRIASLPSSYGERVVIRLLDKSAKLYSLAEIGMDSVTHQRFERFIHLEHGLILVTGPTGSGKSTTLYAALQAINTRDRNVLTLEDPIEYEITGVSQTQINVKKGLTFATGLRNVLRQDPDIIMVGEIRDHETAVMAIQSALTGHLVFSTLHTNDAASAVTRLLDLGIEPYLLSSSLVAVLAQRLVRKICQSCKQSRVAESEDLEVLGLLASNDSQVCLNVGAGCEACRGTGYRGRIGVFEMLIINDAIRKAIQNGADATTIRDEGLHNGMRLLRQDGLDKIFAGQTTIDEVERVTIRTSD